MPRAGLSSALLWSALLWSAVDRSMLPIVIPGAIAPLAPGFGRAGSTTPASASPKLRIVSRRVEPDGLSRGVRDQAAIEAFR